MTDQTDKARQLFTFKQSEGEQLSALLGQLDASEALCTSKVDYPAIRALPDPFRNAFGRGI